VFWCACVHAEVPLSIVTPLQDQEVMEQQAAEFACEVSKPNQTGKWRRNGVDVVPAGRYVIKVDGTRHVLTVSDVEKTDEAQYSVHFTGDLASSANLTVTGTYTAAHTGGSEHASPQSEVCPHWPHEMKFLATVAGHLG